VDKAWIYLGIGLIWFYVLLWPLMGLEKDGSIEFADSFAVWIRVAVVTVVLMAWYEGRPDPDFLRREPGPA
jgi:branched-chain amino acid transport system permease protein